MLSWDPPVLFLTTIVNQLPVVSLLVPTEPVYVYLGAQLPSGTGWGSLSACILGVWIGSQGAFWLGRIAGARVVERMPVADGAVARARGLFDSQGACFVVVAQLIWPISTLTQVLAGVWGMRPATYLVASALGSVLAIAQYAAIGYASAMGLSALGFRTEGPPLLRPGTDWMLIGFAALLVLGAALIPWRGRRSPPLRVAYVGLLALGMLLAVNLGTLGSRTEAAGRLSPLPSEATRIAATVPGASPSPVGPSFAGDHSRRDGRMAKVRARRVPSLAGAGDPASSEVR